MKPLYIDSVIASTALNIEFYNKVNILAPLAQVIQNQNLC